MPRRGGFQLMAGREEPEGSAAQSGRVEKLAGPEDLRGGVRAYLLRSGGAAARRIPGSLGKSPWRRVVITQRGQGNRTLSRASSPIVSVRPTQAFSTKSFSPEVGSTTSFGGNSAHLEASCGISC